jgi:hypothetical protein
MTFQVFAQFQEMEPVELNFINFSYSRGMNVPGLFSIVLEADMLKYLIPGMDIRIDWRGEPQFTGRLGTLSSDTDDTISFAGKDELAKLNDRLINWAAANSSSPYKLEDMNASDALKELFKIYTGLTSTDTAYDVTTYVTTTNTLKKWKFRNKPFAAALMELADTSSISPDEIGFSLWIDGNKKVRFDPLGSGTYHDNMTFQLQALRFDNTQVVNDVQFLGSRPPPIPTDQDDWTEIENGEEVGANEPWKVTNVASPNRTPGGGMNLCQVQEGHAVERLKSVVTNANALDNSAPLAASVSIRLRFDELVGDYAPSNGTSYDWSDGEGTSGNGVVERPRDRADFEQAAQYNNTIGNNTLESVRFRVKVSKSRDGSSLPYNARISLTAKLITSGGDMNLHFLNPPLWGGVYYQQQFRFGPIDITNGEPSWVECVAYPYVETGDTPNISNVQDLELQFFSGTPAGGSPGLGDPASASNPDFIFVDNLSFQFYEIKINKRNTDSISRIGLRSKSFSNKDTRDWKAGWAITKGILSKLEKDRITGDVKIPFDPNIQINDIVNVVWKGRKFKLIVRYITVTSDEMMSLTVGSENPDILAVMAAFKTIEINTQQSGQGYRLQSAWNDDKCFELCESQCEEVCQQDKNQTAAGILTAEGITIKNPCLEGCETYLEIDL